MIQNLKASSETPPLDEMRKYNESEARIEAPNHEDEKLDEPLVDQVASLDEIEKIEIIERESSSSDSVDFQFQNRLNSSIEGGPADVMF